MAQVKILIPGYARESARTEHVLCTTTLIINGQQKIIFDPGADQRKITRALKKHHLKLTDITHVFLSHKHVDHSLAMGIFLNAAVITSKHYNKKNVIKDIPLDYFGQEIKIIKTPGHTPDHASLLVETDLGKILVAGDLWWWWENEKQKTDYKSLINKKDSFADNKKKLINSRRLALKIANYIIPGHGPMFKNLKK